MSGVVNIPTISFDDINKNRDFNNSFYIDTKLYGNTKDLFNINWGLQAGIHHKF